MVDHRNRVELIQASMTNFVDWMLASGATKVAKVQDHKEHLDTNISDFYRPVRELIVDVSQWKKGVDEFDKFVGSITDKRAIVIFPEIVRGWKRFVKKVEPTTFIPPQQDWPVGGTIDLGSGREQRVAIHINPEVGLVIKGEPHIVKLYMRGEPLSQARVDVTVALMEHLKTPSNKPMKRAVMDVRKGELRFAGKRASSAVARERMRVLLVAEGAGYAAAYTMI